ncbi:MAG: DNA gyrase/topoisomerase IV subunit A, partial [Muribaculaceae bacterium]|nr:DNA gyrase/topoisomerase IV subunit A [Muribaculaceae bacterium]
VMRVNYDGRGTFLGEFGGNDRILVILESGEFYTTGFEVTNHYDDKVLRIEKFDDKKVWTAVLNDADQGYPYIKRFTFEDSPKRQRYVGDDSRSSLILLSDHPSPLLQLVFADNNRVPAEIDAEGFIGVKSFKAHGKRLTTYALAQIVDISPEPARDVPETEETIEAPMAMTDNDEPDNDEPDNDGTDNGYSDSDDNPTLFDEVQ